MATSDLETELSAATDAVRQHAANVERLQLLVAASSSILEFRTVEDVLPRVLDLARRTLLADAYALWEHDSRDGSWRVAAHSGLSAEYVEAATSEIKGQPSDGVSLDEPLVAEDIEEADWLLPGHKQAHLAEGNRSMLVVALHHRGETLGTLALYFREPHRFSEAEKSAAEMLANLAAVAIANAQLHEEQSRLNEERRLVAEASALLASSLDYQTTLSNVAALAVLGFADWCSIDMVDESGELKRLTVAHVDPAKVRWAEELANRFPVDPEAPYGVAHVIRTGKSELLAEIPDGLLVEATRDAPELLGTLRELGLQSSICVPLIARERVLGAITFVSAEHGRTYDENDLATAEDLARRAAVAVDNALLYREAAEAHRQAQDSLAVLDAVFATAPVGLALLDHDGRYVRVNEALAALNGCSVEAHIGRTPKELLPGVGELVEPFRRHVLETGAPVLEIGIQADTPATPGEPRSWLTSYYPVRGENDQVVGVGVVVTDVTEQEDALAAARAASDRLSILADASSQLASTLDYERTLANIASLLVPRFADWYAVDIVDDLGRWRRIAVVHKDPDKAEWAAKSQRTYGGDPDEPEGPGRVVRTGEPVLYERVTDELIRSSTKDERHYEVLRQLGIESAMVVPLTAGGRTFGTLQFVSADPERLYDEDDLNFAQHLGRRAAVAIDNARLYRASQQRARAAVAIEHVGDGVVLVDRAGIIRLWNPAAERITGLPAERVLGQRADSIFPTWASIAPLSQTGGRRAELRPAEIGGRELWLSVTGVDFEEGSVYALRDLTAERAVDQLKSDFVATVSHELRTPLAAIYGAALTLQREDVRLGEPQRSGLLEVIASESDRLARIVNDILWASRLESGALQTTIERCDSVELARSVVDAAVQYVPPNIRLSFDAPDESPLVAADPDKVRQVLGNLVENAVKYSPDGGRVRVSVTGDETRVRFTVRDEGLGIPVPEHERIFEKFYRLDPNLTRGVGGTGLGLYISRELVERMDGRIWVESDGSGGSTFSIELPRPI
jgi:PAS domain S-box-containing protein